MNIIPFDAKTTLPAHLRAANVQQINSDLLVHAGGGFPVLSIKGKQWAIVRDGERKMVMNPKDPDSPATSLDLVLIKVNNRVSKVYYESGYTSDSQDKPDCYSPDGSAPMADSKKPQAKSCATCPKNQWGSKITEGGKKAKACQDSVRMAVAPAGFINDPMLLRVPPASIRALGEYGQDLAKRGVAYNAVVTKIGFDPNAESPKLTFKAVGFLDEGGYHEGVEQASSDIVKQIIGGLSAAAEVGQPAQQQAAVQAAAVVQKASNKTVTPDEVEQAVQAATAPAKPAAKTTTEANLDVDLSGIDFDDN